MYSINNIFKVSAIQLLIFSNTIIFLFIEIFQLHFIYEQLGLRSNDFFQLWQPLSYLFLHGDVWHLFFNMLMLWMFGQDIERKWGKYNFTRYFFVVGIGSGILTILYQIGSHTPIIGSSGAVYGIILAYALNYPNRIVYFFGFLPIKVKYMILIFTVLDFTGLFTPGYSNISHITHISGLLIGLVILARKGMIPSFNLWIMNIKIKKLLQTQKNLNDSNDILIYRANIILEKLKDASWEDLTMEEEQILKDVSDKFFHDSRPN